MTQILHFTDFGVRRPTLERWLEKDIPSRIREEAGYEPVLFVDSGGYRLLYNTHVDTESFGFSTSVPDILRLQSRFGGHIIASLDYPLPPNIVDSEAVVRIDRTIANAVELLERVQDDLRSRFFVLLAVHGRTFAEARETTVSLLQKVEEAGLTDARFGLAIGSLVPLARSPLAVTEIVNGVVTGVQECEWLDTSQVPVHAFGISSRMIPYLALLGVDMFDGSTYIQAARHLNYIIPGRFSVRNFLDLELIECECAYCVEVEGNGLEETKQVLKGPAYVKVTYGGRKTDKSYVYSLIALHNLEATYALLAKLKKAVDSRDMLATLLSEVGHDPKMQRVLANVARMRPELADFLWQKGLQGIKAQFDSAKRDRPAPMSATEPSSDTPLDRNGPRRQVRLSLGPEAFDINKTDYVLPHCRILLILPCSRQKPYSKSRSHKQIARLLTDLLVAEDDVHKVTLSGNYGPVPEEFEDLPAVQSYDFYLNPNDDSRSNLLSSRLLRFLRTQESRFDHTLAYCTTRSYRNVLEQTFKDFPNATLLPDPLRARRSSEFLKHHNLAQLKAELIRLMGRNG